jgi:uncharacterized damage-inducible protein DinB
VNNQNDTLSVGSAFLNQSVEYLLNNYQPKIERCLEQLSDEQIWWRPNPSSNSIGNLILHLCGNVRQWILSGLGNEPDHRVRDSEFEQTEVIPRADLEKVLDETLGAVKALLETWPPETLLEHRKIQGKDVGVLEAVYHVTEHFAMHTGQIITLTKLLAQKDLAFYEFDDTVPRERWQD